MKDFLNIYFGPLSKEYCLYFYFMQVFFFVLVVIGVLGIIGAVISNKKHRTVMFVVHSLTLLLNGVLAYFVNRLLYTMCQNSVP